MSSSSSLLKICMNGLCGTSTTPKWMRGWPMKAGGFATLCYSCGAAYDNVNYCERFHLNEPGWRECKTCDKPIHCGCVVSKYLYQCLDLGGISCMKCLRASATQPLKTGIPNGFAPFSGISNWHPAVIGKRVNGGDSLDKGKPVQLNGALEKRQYSPLTSSIGNQIRQDENRLSSREFGMSSPSKDTGALFATPGNSRLEFGPKTMHEVLPQPSSGFSLGNALCTPNSAVIPIHNGIVEGREREKVPSFKQGQWSRHTYAKQSKSGVSIHSQPNKGMVSENRVARRPAEGRGNTQLLPRYWPKITDQELQQISGDLNSNCTITPLFEKVLSASDAGRIGRLVLPKACAEAYFPTINQSDGLPIRIQDIKGKEWTFQFRFWPNNNSRMYVLEGITPCIQSMQLQAGDTVIFSRLDPQDKLVIGCRKATVAADTKENETSAVPNGGASSGGNENQLTHEDMANGDSVQRPHKKKSRNIGSKSKRLLMHSDDAIELKVTWEEAQELFRPPSTSKPTVITIENCEIEEYDEPPVFSKKTVLTTKATRSQGQWGRCDRCSKWQKSPSGALLPPKWTCSDKGSDPDRCSCSSAPDEVNMKDLERVFRYNKESKKRRVAERSVIKEEKQQQEEQEPSGLDALANAAVLGESVAEFGESSVSSSTTTRHPRHRPGCTCIVCIQPPSGKGKHKPNCICNVCSTVKRRFKTLMLRRKKRLLERDGEAIPVKDETEPGSAVGLEIMRTDNAEKKGGQQLDLNCDPIKEEESISLADASGIITVGWQNMLTGLVPCSMSEGISDMGQGHPPPTDEGCPSPMDEAVKLETDSSVVEGR